MDGHTHGPLSDEALEREIEAALAVDPSPEFLARVRARVAAEDLDGGWNWRWAWAGAAVVAIAAVVLGFSIERATPVDTENQHLVAAPRTLPPLSVSEGPSPIVRDAPAPVPVARRTRPLRPSARVTKPEVLISTDEAGALQRLFDALNKRRIEASVLPDLDTAARPLAPIDQIVLEPITLGPIAGLDSE